MKQAISLAAVAGALLLLYGCNTYGPSGLQHTYVTSTQDYHQLAGIDFYFKKGPTDPFSAVSGNKLYIYVDGRLACKHSTQRNGQTFVQLPPGEHEIVLQKKEGLGVAGFGVGLVESQRKIYRVRLASSARAEASIRWIPEGKPIQHGNHNTSTQMMVPVMSFSGCESVDEVQ